MNPASESPQASVTTDKFKIVSVIIPLYNMEKYVRECLESVKNQIYPWIEIIVIDDGSTDSSGSIADSYAARDSRFRVLHTENTGVAAASNLGLSVATGTFCYFLGSDDILPATALQTLVSLIEMNDTDIAIGVCERFSDEVPPQTEESQIELINGSAAIRDQILFDKKDLYPLEQRQLPVKLGYQMVSCLYRRDILVKHGIEFLPLTYGEDTYLCFAYLLHCVTAITTTHITYWYRRNLESVTFQYHPDYLLQTHRYYSFYLSLFTREAPDLVERARSGLDAQFFLRCVSAIERELFMSPPERSVQEKRATLREIRRDPKFRELLTWQNISRVPLSSQRRILRLLYLRQYRLVAFLPSLLEVRNRTFSLVSSRRKVRGKT